MGTKPAPKFFIMHIQNVLSALQSGMVFGRDDMCRTKTLNKHIVPTKSTPNALLAFGGTKGALLPYFYKHIIPTGLKSISTNRKHGQNVLLM